METDFYCAVCAAYIPVDDPARYHAQFDAHLTAVHGVDTSARVVSAVEFEEMRRRLKT